MFEWTWGILGGGIGAVLMKIFEVYWLNFRLSENIRAKRELNRYGKSLWFAFHQFELRIKHLSHKKAKNESLFPPLIESHSIAYYTTEGYFLTSTVYLFALVGGWIHLYQKEIVFLKFSNSSHTAAFFELIESFKRSIAHQRAHFWFHYFEGMGEKMINPVDKMPYGFGQFTTLLSTDPYFEQYFQQAFYSLIELANSENSNAQEYLLAILANTNEIKRFLLKSTQIPLKLQAQDL